jgi:hypothetical protein
MSQAGAVAPTVSAAQDDDMDENFYATLAQVLPLLLLAFIWDSGFLVRLRRQRRLPRQVDPAGVRLWTKPRVRIYTLAVASVVILSTAITMFVLGGLIPDSYPLRVALSAGLVLVLLTLLTRIVLDVLWATAPVTHPADSPDRPGDDRGVPSAACQGPACDGESSGSAIPADKNTAETD